MKINKHLAVVIALLYTGTAGAVVFQGSATGSWTNPSATYGYSISNLDNGGVATVNWGTPADPLSFNNQFTFDGIGSDGDPEWSTTENTAFLIGDFTYRNGAVTNHDFTGVDLSIALALSSPLALSETYTFDFDVTNTPNNTGDPVLDGDIVTVTSTLGTSIFTYDSVEYTLEILGFSSDGGATIRTDFSSPEYATAAAGLYAKITTNVHGVDEPVSLALLGIGLLGLVATRRRTTS